MVQPYGIQAVTEKAEANAPAFLSCRFQHIFNENAVPGIRGIYEDMRHGTHQLPILNNGAAAHE